MRDFPHLNNSKLNEMIYNPETKKPRGRKMLRNYRENRKKPGELSQMTSCSMLPAG